jgi:hypothetical protein
MLETLIPKLIKDLDLKNTDLKTASPGIYSIPLDENLSVTASEIASGIQFKCALAPMPQAREEIFTTHAMTGNLFGQGTRGSIIGLTLDGKTLTLTRVIDYNIDYKEFKELLEDFINTVDFWRSEALNHK